MWRFTTAAAPADFTKVSPSNGATGLPATNITMAWEAQPASAGAVRYELLLQRDSLVRRAVERPDGHLLHAGRRSRRGRPTTGRSGRGMQSGRCVANGGTWWTYHVGPPADFGKIGPPDGWTALGRVRRSPGRDSVGAASYEYCIDTTNDGACAAWTNVGTATSAALSGLDPWTPRYWQVRAVNASGTTPADRGRWWTLGGLQLSGGSAHTCELRGDGALSCWGGDHFGPGHAAGERSRR